MRSLPFLLEKGKISSRFFYGRSHCAYGTLALYTFDVHSLPRGKKCHQSHSAARCAAPNHRRRYKKIPLPLAFFQKKYYHVVV